MKKLKHGKGQEPPLRYHYSNRVWSHFTQPLCDSLPGQQDETYIWNVGTEIPYAMMHCFIYVCRCTAMSGLLFHTFVECCVHTLLQAFHWKHKNYFNYFILRMKWLSTRSVKKCELNIEWRISWEENVIIQVGIGQNQPHTKNNSFN